MLRTLSPSPKLLRDVGAQEMAIVARWAVQEFSECYLVKVGWHLLYGGVTPQTAVVIP